MQLGRYQILKQLATGGVADVLLARASGLEGFARHVVIKRIKPELTGEARFVESFLDEARIAASLHHQNIVQVHDIGEQDGAYFFAMEYVHGEDVRKLLLKIRDRDEQVPLDHVVAIVTATAAGLHHAHEKQNPGGEALGLVHRDVSPANILIGYDGSVKLVDFGLAKAALRSTKTASGTLKGKASYMSPEQCCGRPVDRRTDTFALGIVLYELATGRRLFKATSEFMTMAAIVEGEVPPPSKYRPDLPPAFDEIALRALAKSPESRFQSADDMRAALEEFGVEHQLRTSNKSLADYLTSVFGHRLEPWHVDSESELAWDPDGTAGKGLVAPPDDSDLIKRHAPRSNSPLMLAQTMGEPGAAEWEDDDDHIKTTAQKPSADMVAKLRSRSEVDQVPTRNERLSAEMMAVLRPDADDLAEPPPPSVPARASSPARPHTATEVEGEPTSEPQDAPTRPADDDPFGSTLVAPPIFDEVQQAELARRAAADDDDDEMDSEEATIAEADPPHADSDHPAYPPSRPSTDAVYVGPPAPPPRAVSDVMDAPVPPPAAVRVAPSFFDAYKKSIAIGAAAGIAVVVSAVLIARSCNASTPAPALDPPPAANDGGVGAPASPSGKKPPRKPVGSAR